ncbi:MAG: universal stress protein [Anaerolineae bacterium]
MGLVLAAIRGGPASNGAEDTAIELARAGGHRLLFLHVVEGSLFDLGAGVRTEAVIEELRELGEFVVTMAQERARAAGVEADGLVRVGHVPDEIVAIVKERGADVLVLGTSQRAAPLRPAPGGRQSALAQRVHQETGADVVVVPAAVEGG